MDEVSSVFGIDAWFCCLNAQERSILRSCTLAYVTFFGSYVPCEVVDAFWFPVVDHRVWRQTTFNTIFGISQMELDAPLSPYGTCVYTFTPDTVWIALAAYILESESACLDGCERWRPA